MPDELTPEQVAQNEAAQECLVRGNHYRFEPPITATAIPIAGTGAWNERRFIRGWYLGFKDGVHVFQGKPVDYRGRSLFFFRVQFIGGSKAIPEDQPKKV